MKGVVLAGGQGTRLRPLTVAVNKHLLPVYNKPLIYWPVMTLVRMGIKDILIVSNPGDRKHYKALFGNGEDLGVSISYDIQQGPGGIADALAVAEPFARDSSIAVILGDNIFMDSTEIRDARIRFLASDETEAMVFLKEVPDPERFGVASISGESVQAIEEKPSQPASNLAVTGLYFYKPKVFEIVKKITPSARGELEITGVNNVYATRGGMRFHKLAGAWIDAGTYESLLQASQIAAGMDLKDSKKIKILFGVNELNIGGAQNLVLSQLKHINRDRFDSYLMTFLPSAELNLNAQAEYLGEHWVKFSFKGFFDPKSFLKLYRFLRRERFDVVVTNLFFSGFVLRFAAIFARVPIILATELNVYYRRSWRQRWAEKFLSFFTDRLIAVSKETIDVYSKQLNLPLDKFALNYSAIEVDPKKSRISNDERQQLRDKYGLRGSDIVITAAGRLVEQKGQRYLIEAFSQVKSILTDKSLKLVIFGNGELRDQLLEQIKKLDLTERVQLPGNAPVREIIGITDIFVMPSLWEGMSVMLLEVMAGSKPIVATDVSGSRELITDKENGFLVSPKNSAELADKIKILVHDENLRRSFAQASLKEVQKFSIESNLNNLYAIIHDARRKKKII
jgi:glucose-1-phosphate thymidylyltransferase